MPDTRRGVREAKRMRSRRIRAILAGGLMFGVGAAMTLAAWTDSEHAGSTFTAGTFGIVGSTNGTNFAEHNPTAQPPEPPAAAATLSFTVAPTAMVPGMTTYALFSVKTAPTSVAGALALVSGTQTGALATALTYGVRILPAGTVACNSTSFTASTEIVVPTGSALSVNGAPTETVPQVVSAAGASQVNYCLAVTLKADADDAMQGASASKTWQIVGTSS